MREIFKCFKIFRCDIPSFKFPRREIYRENPMYGEMNKTSSKQIRLTTLLVML